MTENWMNNEPPELPDQDGTESEAPSAVVVWRSPLWWLSLLYLSGVSLAIVVVRPRIPWFDSWARNLFSLYFIIPLALALLRRPQWALEWIRVFPVAGSRLFFAAWDELDSNERKKLGMTLGLFAIIGAIIPQVVMR